MTNIAKPTEVKVSRDGELVLLNIGDIKFSIEFDLALRISSALLVEGRIARKIQQGVNCFPRVRTSGLLVDLNAIKKRRSRFQKLAERLKYKDIEVKNAGANVSLRFAKIKMDLPWNAALSIAQWLRIHAKMARNESGSMEQWSKIAAS